MLLNERIQTRVVGRSELVSAVFALTGVQIRSERCKELAMKKLYHDLVMEDKRQNIERRVVIVPQFCLQCISYVSASTLSMKAPRLPSQAMRAARVKNSIVIAIVHTLYIV